MVHETLGTIRTAPDVRKMFAALGYIEEDLPFADDAFVVARWRAFKVVAADGASAKQGARELAGRLAVAAERALAVVVGADREIALAAPRFGQSGITRVLVVSRDNPSRFAVEQLERLRPSAKATALSHALYVADVLSSEEVGERFFTAFRTNLERMAAAIDRSHSLDDRRMVALLCLTRILFLYFVQAKGWLDGRYDYLRQQLDSTLAQRRSFHRSILQPLFFETLNKPPQQRCKKARLGYIPYLNGGLFELHPSERRVGKMCFSNRIWRDVFDELFERFRFTVRENDEVDAIAPDMLGRVFERLMNADVRHQSGTYYTPEAVVRRVVTATIETSLQDDIPRSVYRKLIAGEAVGERYSRTAREALKRVRVLDPAVGSGAFLLEALCVLSHMRLALEPVQSPAIQLRLRKEILRENLMGIDLNPVAVRLAELRLWLAVVADDPTSDIAKVAPLPNLDGVVRQGDTLLDPLGAARSFSPNAHLSSSKAADAVRAARKALFDMRGREYDVGARQLRNSELAAARQVLRSAIDSIQHATKDLTTAAESRDLFGKKNGLTASQGELLRSLARIERELQAASVQLAEDVLPFFSFEVHAPDVLAGGGFTAVVGNPPWVRAEHLSHRLRRSLGERFNWWKATGRIGFAHLPDLSIAFLERCLELTRKRGAIGLLLPSKLTSAGYGENARRGVVSETSIAYLHRVSDREASSFGATTYPLALVAKKEPASPNHSFRLGFDTEQTIRQDSLNQPGPWILLGTSRRKALEEFRSAGTPLGDVAPPMLGVKTGADRLFVGRVKACEAGIAIVAFRDRDVRIELAVLRPVLRGRDVRSCCCQPSGVLVWCHDGDGRPLKRLPEHAANYFNQIGRKLHNRADYRAGPIWTLFRTRCVSKGYHVVWPDIAKRPRATVLEETKTPTAIPLNTCYVTEFAGRESALATAAVLNSAWGAALVAASADEARGGYRRINARVTRNLPVPGPGNRRAALAQLCRQIHENQGSGSENLDEAVATTFGLSSRTQEALRSIVNHNG